jgi:hypothetical protein
MEKGLFIIIIVIIIITRLCIVFAHIQVIFFEGQHGTLTKFFVWSD